MAGTDQQIGFGAFAGMYTITPTQCDGSGGTCTVLDTDIQTELLAQITAGNLPAPVIDTAGHVDTIYMVHFPVGVKINQGGNISCQQFCGTWTNFTYQSSVLTATLIPDQAGTCSTGCGGGAVNYLDIETFVSNFVLIDSLTDPLAGSASVVGRPLAWYGPLGGVSATCNSGTSTVTAAVNGHSYVVNKLWSNRNSSCISSSGMHVVKPSAGAHGTLAPNSLQAVAANQSASFTVTPDPTYTAVMSGTCGGSLIGTTYMTGVVTADCTVIATFIDQDIRERI